MRKLTWLARTFFFIAIAALGVVFVPWARAQASTQLAFNPTVNSVVAGSTVTVSIDLNAVSNLYGYQFQVNYDATKVSASGTFVNVFFDTTSSTFIPAGWNAACASGVCKFAASHLNNAGPLSGSGTVARITFTGLAAGSVPLSFSSDLLADRDGNAIGHTTNTASITVSNPVPGGTQLLFNPTSGSVAVGNSIVISIDVASVTDLYGYQFQVNYDATKVSAGGAFVNSFFDTTNDTFIPAGWNASCAAGVCKFAASHLNSASPISGSGTIARITFTGLDAGSVPLAFSSDLLADRDGNAIPHTSNVATITVFNAPPGSTQLLFNPASSSVAVGNSVVVSIDLASVTNLYGYQLQVNYDASKVSASGAFVNTFFDSSSGAFIPSGWNASCASGTCKFAVTHLNSASPVAGSGTLAQITFTGVSGGTVPLSFSADILADRDGNSISHTSGTGTIVVYGYATISGTVVLQGRATPISSGTVTLTDNSNYFAPTVVTFSATTGNFTATVPVQAAGSTYNLTAAHSLYLSNQLNGVAVSIGGSYPQATTTLHAGDGTNDGVVDVLDLSCVGGNYGGSPSVCATTGFSDLNEDGVMDIFDLVLVGSNYGLTAPQPW